MGDKRRVKASKGGDGRTAETQDSEPEREGVEKWVSERDFTSLLTTLSWPVVYII